MFETANVTTPNMYAGATIGGESVLSWFIILILIIIFLITLFLMFKYFRLLCYGAVILIPTAIGYMFSKGAVDDAAQGDYTNLTIYLTIVCVALICLLIGYGLSKTKYVKKLEKEWTQKND